MKTIHADSVHLRATGDFKKRARHTILISRRLFKRTVSIVLVAALIVVVVAVSIRTPISAATYTWTQSSWSGGATANTAVHPTSQNGWTEYSSKDATVTTGGALGLLPQAQTVVQTSDTDFQAGTLSQTVISGSGSNAGVVLGADIVENSTLGGYNSVAMNRIQRGFTLDTTRHTVWSTTVAAAWVNYRYASDGTYATSTPCNNQGYDPIYDATNDVIWQGGTGKTLCKISPADGTILNTYTFASLPGDIKMMALDPVRGLLWFNVPASGRFYSINATSQALSGPYIYAANLTATPGWYLDASCSGAVWGPQHKVVYEPGTQTVWGMYCESMDDEYGPSNSAVILVGINASNGTFSRSMNTEAGIGLTQANQAGLTSVPTSSKTLWFNPATESGYAGFYTYNPSTGEQALVSAPQMPLTAIYDSYHNSVWSVSLNNFAFSKLSVEGALQNSYDGRSTSPRTDATVANGCSGGVYDPYNRQLWHCAYKAAAPTGNGAVRYQYGFSSQYYASGTITSSIMDVGPNVDWSTLTWTDSLPASTTVTMKTRSSNDPAMVGANDFSNPACTNVSKGQDISASGCITDGHRYIQYQATLGTSNSANTPTLSDITIGYRNYQSGTLTSSAFDTLDATNVIGKVQWTSTGSGTVRYQLRTSPDNATWTSWVGPTGAGDFYTDYTGGQTINASHRDGVGDRYVQYQVAIIPQDAGLAPTVTSTTLSYVVNAPPEIESAPTAVQNSDGSVSVSYSVRDPDTDAGSTTPGYLTPTFEYSLNNGTNWNAVTTGLSAGATSNKSVDDVIYTQYSLTWNAKSQIDGTYASQAKVRVRVNDNEGANNTAFRDSAAFVLDVKNPTLGSPAISVDATTTPSTVTLNSSDDTALEMCITLDNTQTNCVPYASSTTVGLATNPDTVYVVFRDARGNIADANAVTPETPQNVIIRDLSNIDANQFFLFISWKTVSTPLGQFSGYKIWHATDGTNYSLLETINDRSSNYYLHQGLSDNSTHYYKVSTVDTSGNVSYFSTVVNDTVNGQGGTDATPPTITNVSTSSITTQSAIVSWDTDELSNSTVGFSATPGVFTNEVGVSTMLDSATGLGRHAVILTNLEPARTYFYRVLSSDPNDNTATSDNGGDGFSFTTIAGPTITNVTTPSIENTQATITWQTNLAADSEIVYSTNAALTSPLTASDATELTNHSLTLTNLALGTRYYFKVRSGTATDTNAGNYYTFVTTSDATPPVISGVTADPITDTEAVIQWQTNEKSTSRVRYGTSHGTFTVEVPENLTLNLSHSVTLKNLTPDSTYHVAVESADAAGNRTTGDEYDFVTLEKLTPESEVVDREDRARAENSDATAPAITGLVVSDVTDAAAAVTWQTNETANSFVEFGPAGSEPIIYGNWVFVTDHTISLTALAASTTYQYRVVSVDESGNVATTSQATFTTAAPSTVGLESRLEQEYERLLDQGKSVPIPVIGGEPRVEVAPTSATVTWTTDKPANGFVAVASATDYQSDRREPYVQIVGDPERYGSRHTVTLSNLLPDTVYHYQVRSRTTVSEVAQTRDATFRTPKRTFAIDNYVVEKMNESEAIFRWTTTDEATAMVKFIPYRNNIRAVDEVQIVRVDAYTVIHQVSVTRFEPGVKYDVELISAQRNGSLASRTIDAFSTEAVTTPPSINGIAVDTALSAGEKVKVQTIVSWSTNKPTTGRVTYHKGVAKNDDPFTESSPVDANYTKKHVIVLTTLEPGTVYQYRVESTDSAGQVSVSKPMTILTPQQQRTVFQVIFDTVQDTFGWAGLFNR